MSTSYPGDGGDLLSGKVAKMLISYCVLLIAKIVKIFHFVVFKLSRLGNLNCRIDCSFV